jgi:hypothetical protein
MIKAKFRIHFIPLSSLMVIAVVLKPLNSPAEGICHNFYGGYVYDLIIPQP